MISSDKESSPESKPPSIIRSEIIEAFSTCFPSKQKDYYDMASKMVMDNDFEEQVANVIREETKKSSNRRYLEESLSCRLSANFFPPGIIEFRFCLEKAAQSEPLTIIDGKLKLDASPVLCNIEVSYDLEKDLVIFNAVFSLGCEITITPDWMTIELFNKHPAYPPAYLKYYYSRFAASIPLKMIRCWIKGKIQNLQEGVKLLNMDMYSVTYSGQHSFPIRIYSLFKSLGPEAFHYFAQAGYMTDEVFEITIQGLRELEEEYENPFLAEDEIDDHQDDACTEQRRSVTREQIEAVQVPKVDRERLRKIDDVRETPLSYSQWAEILGFKSKGAVGPFFQRMAEDGLIIIEKTADGTTTRLTERGRRAALPS